MGRITYIIEKKIVEQGQGNQADITASGGGGLGCVMWTGARHYALTVTARSDPCDPATNGGAEAANRPNGSATTRPSASVHRPHGPAHLAHARAWGCMYAALAVWPRAPGLRGRQRHGCSPRF